MKKMFSSIKEELIYFKQQVEILSMEKNNLLQLLNCLSNQLDQENFDTNTQLNSNNNLIPQPRVNAALKKSQILQDNKNKQNKANILLDQLLESQKSKTNVRKNIDRGFEKYFAEISSPNIDVNRNVTQSNHNNEFVGIDILHQTCRLIEKVEQSQSIDQIFCKHFVNAKNLYLMIKMQTYDHALIKMMSFSNEILNVVMKMKQKDIDEEKIFSIQKKNVTQYTKNNSGENTNNNTNTQTNQNLETNFKSNAVPYFKIRVRDRPPMSPTYLEMRSADVSIINPKSGKFEFSQYSNRLKDIDFKSRKTTILNDSDHLKDFVLKLIKKKSNKMGFHC